MKRLASLLLVLLSLTAQPPLRAADDLPRASAQEETAVRALLGKKAIITGHVSDAVESSKGMTFINFTGGQFTVIAYKDNYDKFEGGSPAKLYKGKTIEITGEVFEYRSKGASKDDPGKLEIKLSSPDQIKILATEPAPDDPKEPKDVKDTKASDPKPSTKSEVKKVPPTDPETKPDRVESKKYFR